MNGGPAVDLIDRGMSGFDPYRRFLGGRLARRAYSEQLVRARDELVGSTGLTENEVSLSVRLSFDAAGFAAAAYGMAAAAVGLPSASKESGRCLREAQEAIASYDHGARKTYIFPEEGALTHLVAAACDAGSVVSLGSYYGYWSAWAATGLSRGVSLTLVDSDPAVCAVAEENMRRLGVEADVTVVCADAIDFLGLSNDRYDLVLLDAEGPAGTEDPRRRRKAVYGPIVEALLPVAAPGALLLAHNILLGHPFPDPYFDRLVATNTGELLEFHQWLGAAAVAEMVIPTVEGLGIYRLR